MTSRYMPLLVSSLRPGCPSNGRDRHGRGRYGYRRVHGPLRREGWAIYKKTQRVYSELGLQLRNKTRKLRCEVDASLSTKP